MNEYIEKIDNTLKDLLQKDLKFTINNNNYKEGKLILFTHGYFCLNIKIKNKNKNKNELLKIPLPFNIEYHKEDDLLYFDYRIKTFSHNNELINNVIKRLKKDHVSKFYDKIMTIEVINATER